MHKKLTISLAERVYEGLHERIGRGSISGFIEDLVRTEPFLAMMKSPALVDAQLNSQRGNEVASQVSTSTAARRGSRPPTLP